MQGIGKEKTEPENDTRLHKRTALELQGERGVLHYLGCWLGHLLLRESKTIHT